VGPDSSSEPPILCAIAPQRSRAMASPRASHPDPQPAGSSAARAGAESEEHGGASGTGAVTTMEHRTTIVELGEERTQAVCSCGWRSAVFGADKSAGTMDALQEATEARDLHEWDQAIGG